MLVAHAVALAAAGEEIVHDHIIWALEWTSGEKDKGPQGVEALEVDAPDGLNGGLRGDLLNDWGRDSYVRELAQHVGDLCRSRRSADSDEESLDWGAER